MTAAETPAIGPFARAMRRAAKIEPNELAAVLGSFAFVLVTMAAYYLVRPVRDAMSSNWSDAELSLLWTGTFVASTIAAAIYGAICSVVSIRRIVPAMYGFFALSFGVLYIAQTSGSQAWIDKGFYVWISVFSMFHLSVFWTFMADLFTKEQAPRLFGFIAGGASIGAIVGPTIPLALVGVIDREHLTLAAALLLLVPIFLFSFLERQRQSTPSSAAATGRLGSNPLAGFRDFVRNPYLLAIGGFILLYVAISTFVYFELKNLMTPLDEDTRTRIWAGMDLAVNLLAIGTALFATSRIATRFGLAITLGSVPAMICIGLLLTASAPLLAVVVALQIVRRAGNYAITKPGREMLFTAVDRESRYKAKNVIDVAVYRGGDVLTAWAFTGLTQGLGLGLGAVAGIGAAIAAAWACTGVFLGRRFDRMRGSWAEANEPAATTLAAATMESEPAAPQNNRTNIDASN